MMLAELAHGREAAEIFGISRADEVWRAIARHGADYPGRIEVVRIGRSNAVAREELKAFARWYRANVHRETRPSLLPPPCPAQGEATIEKRRSTLRAAIRHLQDTKGDYDERTTGEL